jgi:hypothetical protein
MLNLNSGTLKTHLCLPSCTYAVNIIKKVNTVILKNQFDLFDRVNRHIARTGKHT